METIEMLDTAADTAAAGCAMELDWEFIKAQLPDDWRTLADQMGLIRPHPPHLHAKITDIEQVLRLELQRVALESSLRITTGRSRAAKKIREDDGGATQGPSAPVDISAPSMHGWERKLGPYVAVLNARMANAGEAFAPELWGGYDLMVADGSTVTRPGATGTTARVLYALHLVDMTITQQKVTDEHGGESLREFQVKPGQLWIANRGYSNPEDIAHVKDAGGEVLVRVNRGALPLYDVAGRLIDVMDLVQSLQQPWAMREWTLWVHPKNHEPIMGRLCAMRLPDKEAEQARQRLRREYGAEATPGMLEAASWVMEFVTAPAERIPLPKVFWLYRFRWQVEIQIHRDKSIGGIGNLPNFRDDTIATWLSAKLLLQQIARKIVSPAVALPPQPPAIAAPPSTSPSKVRDTLHQLRHEIVGEMWRVMIFVYQALCAALNPIALRDVPRAVAAYLEHLSRPNERRFKQIELLLLGLDPAPS
jgi:DDE family transposase